MKTRSRPVFFIIFGFLGALVILSVETTLRTEKIKERLSEEFTRRASDTDPGESKEDLRKATEKASEETKKKNKNKDSDTKKSKTKRKKKKRAKFLKFEDDDFSSEVSFKVSVRTSGESCQDLTLRWSGQR